MSDTTIAQRLQVVTEKSAVHPAQRQMQVTFQSPVRADLDTPFARMEAVNVAAANGIVAGGISGQTAISPVLPDGTPITTPESPNQRIEFEITFTVQSTN